ncbi:DUF6089 family protein [Ancylomarina longa]|uniref:DUF6089 domain-containing protein n=1 Tax=Ancylomarina longa TaxID=2487017 RepID=A0A434AFS0_9BACT|nr:DUF6089 family protein [Ancylomarina longa]RUT73210.1 hypothetical protein DLK05_14650 [Ancylomarina longa]
MYKLILGILLFVLSSSAFSQTKAELGIFGGAAYYMGDINPQKQLYSSSVALGGIYRYNFNSRYSLRASMLFSGLSGNDLDFKNSYQQARGASFNTDLVDLSLQVEFNFQPFRAPQKSKTRRVVPYVTSGIGYIAPSSTSSSFTIPMGVGFKTNIKGRWTAALEWSFRKTFTDDLDHLDDPNNFKESNLMHNNDWASFLGIMISYKLFPDNEECHSYDRFVK